MLTAAKQVHPASPRLVQLGPVLWSIRQRGGEQAARTHPTATSLPDNACEGGSQMQGLRLASLRHHVPPTGGSLPWDRLVPVEKHSVRHEAQQNGRGKCCLHCMDTDHTAADCALAPARLTSAQKPSVRDATGGDSRDRRGRSDQPCYSWNEGRCSFPYSRYRHVCARCGGDHRRSHCREAPKGGNQRTD